MVAYQYLYLHRSTPLQFQLEFRQFQFPFYVISCISSVVLSQIQCGVKKLEACVACKSAKG